MSSLIGLTAQSVLQEKASGDASPFLTISADSTVEAAVKLLAENKILSAPVIDGEAILGILDMFDVLQFIVHLYSRQQTQTQTPEGFVGWVTSTWEQRATLYFSENVRSILGIATTDKSLNMNFSSDTLLSQIVHEFAKGHHRAMVFNQEKQPVGVISQTDVIKTIYKHLSEEPLASLKNKKMVELGLGKTGAISISPKATALQGFYLMNYYHISAVGVVDELQRPLANLSISDLKGLHSENFESLLLPVLDYLEVFSPNTKRPPISCSPNSTVEEVLKLVIENGVHRIWNIAADQLYGIISLTDLLVALEGAFRV